MPDSADIVGSPQGETPSLQVGALVRVRQRRWLVEGIAEPPHHGDATLVDLSCADDDAQGQQLSVLWEHEADAKILRVEDWGALGKKGFDPSDLFSAYVHTLRWNSVTATDPNLFQAPFRAGIRIDAYQLEPLRKALALPRVNLFIADDVGLGKTIEAGLIARELLLRRRIDSIVVSAPPSMLHQWRDELESRFGLTFVILDRTYFAEVRRERGYAVNPWTTHSRFLVSHRLLIDETYMAGLRDWLGEFRPRTLLILDEAHHAAPASGARYAIDSQITRAMRDLAHRFEHRLFLSATPHNGHSNSFSALLEILDPQRFVRGVKVRKGDLSAVMIRRLKEDMRAFVDGIPERKVEQVDIRDLPADAPELVLAEKLNAYRMLREARLSGESRTIQNRASLAISTLQQRLLSSIEAFAHTIRVHKAAVERAVEKAAEEPAPRFSAQALLPVGADDDRATLDEEELQRQDDEAVAEASRAGIAGAPEEALRRELTLLEEMVVVADQHRDDVDPRLAKILEWIDVNMCPGIRDRRTAAPPAWNGRRLLIFTEWEDTRRYIERRLKDALAHTDRGADRVAVFSGPTPTDRREELKRAFNENPDKNPIRILIATDAAREGLNLQRQCYDLYHFDLPWNPSRIEQRNGRIDRKLQPQTKVFCRYFFFHQRPEDRVLRALVTKSEKIREELGSMARILESRVETTLDRGFRRDEVDAKAAEILAISDGDREAAIREELEDERERRDALDEQLKRLRRMVERSERRIGLEMDDLRDALSISLKLSGAEGIESEAPAKDGAPALFRFPADNAAIAGDAGWVPVLDMLREPRERTERPWEWRRRAGIRPVCFDDSGPLADDAVQLHLEHRVVQRLLSRFTSQGLIHFDLSRACLTTGKGGEPRVVLLGRLALYGPHAARLHEEIIPVTARWEPADRRKGPLRPFGAQGEERTLDLLEEAFRQTGRAATEEAQKRLLASVSADIHDLLPHLDSRGQEARKLAEAGLAKRADTESAEMRRLLEEQRKRILAASKDYDDRQMTMTFSEDEGRLAVRERRQREADRRAWDRRLSRIDSELDTEPQRIAEGYAVRAVRLEPVGLVYLWPETG